MTNRDFAQLVLGNEPPSLEQRENVVRNGLRDWRYENSYVRVHAVKATSKSEVYAAVSFEKKGERYLTYAVASLKCRRKGDGHWLSAEAFLTTTSTPFTMTDCPDEIFIAGKATGLTEQVDARWYSYCVQSKKVKSNTKALKKGQIFQLDPNSPALEISGEKATFAVVLNKQTARYIAPGIGKTKEADAINLAQHYSPVRNQQVPTFTETNAYAEAGELLFDLTGAVPVLKGRLAVGAKAALLERARNELNRKLGEAVARFDLASKFSSGAWLS